MGRHVWDHTRSPWWNLSRVLGLEGMESPIAGAAVAVLLIASMLVPVRATSDPVIEIVSSVGGGATEPVTSVMPSEERPNATPTGATNETTAVGAARPSDAATIQDNTPAPGAATTTPPAASLPGAPAASSAPSPGAGPTPAPAASASTAPATTPSGSTAPSPAPSAVPSPTVAPPKAELVIGFLRQTGTGESAGFTTPEQGDVENQINTLIAYINNNGGLAGHPVRASIRTVDINNTGRPQEEATCRAFAEDDGAFAVVPLALIYIESRACYAQQGVMLLDPTPFHHSEAQYEALAPFLLRPAYPSTEGLIRAQAAALKSAGYLDDPGIKLGLVSPDTPGYRSAFDTTFKQAYAQYGIEASQVAWVQNDSIQSAQTGSSNASISFATQGVTHVVFFGNSLLAPLFIKNAEGNGYFPRYGVTSYDQLVFMADQWALPQSLEGAVGAGFSPALDVPDSEVAFPSPREQSCIEVMRSGGNTWDSRVDAKNALGYCDAVFLLLQASSRIGDQPLTARAVHDAAFLLGDGYQASLSIGTAIRPGNYDFISQYRPVAYDSGCGCFRYTGPATGIPR